MIKKNYLIFLLIICFQMIIAERAKAQDSSHIQVSLLTCTPGEELYSTFGHTALRIVDSSSRADIVFNFGTFNFDDPGFYTKFIRGKLLYFLSADRFEDFIYSYQATNRGITEQVLNLSADEKIAVTEFLYENIKEENKFYKYDFLYDNCTTRVRDIIQRNKKNHPPYRSVVPQNFTFRNAIHQYLDKNEKYWSKLGIDILLGSPTDKIMSVNESQFLPDNLMKTLDSSNTNNAFVKTSKKLYPISSINGGVQLLTPFSVFSFLLIIVFLLRLTSYVFVRNILDRFDGLFFFLTGLLGIVLIFMWTATDHAMCRNNYNILWALPTHCIAAFFLNSSTKWIKYYLAATIVLTLIILMIWNFLPQQMNTALIPVLLLITYISARKILKNKNADKLY